MKQIGFWTRAALLLVLAVSPVKVASGVSNEEMLKKLVQYLKVIEPALAKPGGPPSTRVATRVGTREATREDLLPLIQKANPGASEIQAAGILHMLALLHPNRGIPPCIVPAVRPSSSPGWTPV
jgi:hypothetical protein